ncbi:MAG: hypothetical protein ACE5HZ_03965 [Fidelibacterota bacterium]
MGLPFHLKKSPHPHLYRRKLDKSGLAVLNVGLILSYEVMIPSGDVSLKMVQGLFLDCANQLAGFTHVGFRGRRSDATHSVSVGIGPTLFYRKDWKNLPGYVDEGLFQRTDTWQYRFIWYAGEVQLDTNISPRWAFSTTLIPGYPEFVAVTSGLQYLSTAPTTP